MVTEQPLVRSRWRGSSMVMDVDAQALHLKVSVCEETVAGDIQGRILVSATRLDPGPSGVS